MTPVELREAERLAKATNRSLSGLIREGLQRLKIEHRWNATNAYGLDKARRLALTESDVVPLTKQVRKEIVAQERRKRPAK